MTKNVLWAGMGLLLIPAAVLAQISAAEVEAVVNNAALSAAGDRVAIVVVDRPGNPLAVYRRPDAGDEEVEQALSLARTGAFFASYGTPLSSRTIRAISRPNFPEGIPNQPAGALFGIENSNRGCDLGLPGLPRLLNAAGNGYSRGIATVPGGVPLFRDGVTVVGGIGVAGLDSDDRNEFAAVRGAQGAGLSVRLPLPFPGAVFLDGFRLPYVNPRPATPAAEPGGTFELGPLDGVEAPEGWLVEPRAGRVLSAEEVAGIVQNALDTANRTRAAIRLPAGSRTRMAIAVGDLDGSAAGGLPDARCDDFFDRRGGDEGAQRGLFLVAGARPGGHARRAAEYGGHESHDRLRIAAAVSVGHLEQSTRAVCRAARIRLGEPVHAGAPGIEREPVGGGLLSGIRTALP